MGSYVPGICIALRSRGFESIGVIKALKNPTARLRIGEPVANEGQSRSGSSIAFISPWAYTPSSNSQFAKGNGICIGEGLRGVSAKAADEVGEGEIEDARVTGVGHGFS